MNFYIRVFRLFSLPLSHFLIMLFIFRTLCWSRLLMLFSFELIAYDIDKHRFAPCTSFYRFQERRFARFKISILLLSSSSPCQKDLRRRDEIYERERFHGNFISFNIFFSLCTSLRLLLFFHYLLARPYRSTQQKRLKAEEEEKKSDSLESSERCGG